jgi:RHS repeat-associated protein
MKPSERDDPRAVHRPRWACLGLLLAVVLGGKAATAGPLKLPELARVLNQVQSDPASDTTAALQEHLASLVEADAQQQREFAAASARKLPPKAAERLAQARAAYAAGHGRLLQILKLLVGPRDANGSAPAPDRATLLREAAEIVRKLQDASGAEPISTTLSVSAPNLSSPLNQPLGGNTSPSAIGPIPAAVQSAVSGLAGPVEIYEAVRNSIRPDFYYGVMKGAAETLRESAGNDADTASVLVLMMRAKGIPARYVRGTIKLPTATLQQLTGTANATQAVRTLQRAGIPVDFDPADLSSVKLERVWAEAYIPYTNYRGALLDAQGKYWIPLDAGFKRLTTPVGMTDPLGALGIDPLALTDEYLSAPQTDSPLQFTRTRVAQQLAARFPDKTYDGVLNRRDLLPESLGILPSSLPYEVVHVTETSYDLPDPLVHQIHVTSDSPNGSIIDATLAIPDVLGQRLTLSYVPFSDEDVALAASYGGIARTPPYLIDVKALIKSGGIAVAAGNQPIGMGVRFTLRLELRSPGGAQTIEDKATAGNLTVIGLGGSKVASSESTTDQAAAILSQLAWHYLDRWNTSDAELANLLRVVPVRPTVSVCVVMSAIQTQYAGGDPLYPLSFDWRGLAVDADRRVSAPVGIETQDAERAFLLLSGLEGSSLEQRLFQDDIHVDSISTNEVLGRAHAEGQTVYDLTSGNVDSVLPMLPFDRQVLAEIRDAAYRGQRVTVPAGNVTKETWTGVGYRLLDEHTGEAAYQLQGGYSGGMTTVDPSQFPEGIRDATSKQGEDPQTSPETKRVAHMSVVQATDFQEGTVGKAFPQPLTVVVTDTEGVPVKGATVHFSTSPGTGDGYFIDDVTGHPVLPVLNTDSTVSYAQTDAVSDARGHATATFVAGTKTNVIPRFIRNDGEEFATQVGLNLISASSGAIILDQPFQEIAFPDYRTGPQGQGVVSADIHLKHWDLPASGTLDTIFMSTVLTAVDNPSVLLTDQYDNPISNVSVTFKADPVVDFFDVNKFVSPPAPNTGWYSARDQVVSSLTPGALLKSGDFIKCMQDQGSIRRAQCDKELPSVTVKSSTAGALAYAVLGDAWFALYYFTIGTDLEPDKITIVYFTSGFACHTPEVPKYACYNGPFMRAVAGTRWFFGRQGQEAHAVDSPADVTIWTDVIWEEERVVKVPGAPIYGLEGRNVWHRDRSPGSKVSFKPATDGTTVMPATATEPSPGVYRTTMGLSKTPQLNTLKLDTQVFPPMPVWQFDGNGQLNYSDFGGKLLPHFDPATIIDGTDRVERRVDPKRPWTMSGTFSLWGIDPKVTVVDPAPILLDSSSHVEKNSVATVDIQPTEYKKFLMPRDVVFDLVDEKGNAVLSANNDLESFTIPRPLPLPEGEYTARVRVSGTATEAVLSTVPLKVDACKLLMLETKGVAFDVNSDPDDPSTATCWGKPQPVKFALCRPAHITVTPKDSAITLSAPLDGGSGPTNLDTDLPVGPHEFLLDPNLPAIDGDYIITATTPDGFSQNEPFTVKRAMRSMVAPIGHTFVKGVDVFDGHVIQQVTDVKVPGRYLGLEITRTYSSSGARDDGDMGAGWAFNYGSSLSESECLVTLSTADGTSVVFHPVDGPNGHEYQAQKGYHGQLTKSSLDGSFVYVDKAHVQHHFGYASPNQPGRLLLDYIEEPHGDRIKVEHDEKGRVHAIKEWHPDGPADGIRELDISYESKGGFDRVKTIDSGPMNLHLSYSYDDWGNLKTATRKAANLPDGAPTQGDRVYGYEYTDSQALDRHNMTAAIDPNGSRTEYVYYPADAHFNEPQLTSIDHTQYVKEIHEIVDGSAHPPDVAPTGFSYDLSAFTFATGFTSPWVHTTVTDARGHDTKYALNIHGSPLTIVAAAGTPNERTTTFEWDTNEKVKSSETDALHRRTEFKHEDHRGNLTEEDIATTDHGTVTTKYEYDPTFNKLSKKIDAEGHVTHYNIGTQGDLMQEIDAANNTTSYTYGNGGLLQSKTAPGGTTTYDAYDTFGNPMVITDAERITTFRSSDARGRITTESDSQGHVRTLKYDAFDRVVSETRVASLLGGSNSSANQVTTTFYYANGEPQTVIQQDGATTTYLLDGMNRVTKTTTTGRDLNAETSAHYDGNGNKDIETDARGVVRKYIYDELNQLREVQIIGGPAPSESVAIGPTPTSTIARYDYDAVGNKKHETDLAGLTTGFDYDGLYRVNKKILPETPYFETYENDRVGNRTAFVDANGHRTEYSYDGLRRLTQTKNALQQVTSIAYDAPPGSHVNKSEEFDATRGLRTTYAYDGDNRETSRLVQLQGAGAIGQQYLTQTHYDDAGPHTKTVIDPNGGKTLYVLNGLDRVSEKHVYVDGRDLVTRTTYNGIGVPTLVVDPLRHPTSYTPDALGRIVTVQDAKGRQSSKSYDAGGLVISQRDRRGIEKKMSYDYLGRLRHSSIAATRSGVPWSSDIVYLDVDKQRRETDARGKTTIFDLDSLGRVKKVTDPLGHFQAMGYDGVNKTSETDKRGNQTIFGYDAINRLTQTTDPAPFANQTVKTVYQDSLNKKTVVDRRGLCTETQMDPLGRPTAIMRGACAGAPPVMAQTAIKIESHSYDGNGNTVLSADGAGKQTHFDYDAANRLKNRVAGFGSPDAATTTYGYDDAGNQTIEIDARALALRLPFSTKRDYDELNRVTFETNGAGEKTEYGYDEEGNRNKVTLPGMSVSTLYDYDELGKLRTVTQPSPGPGQPGVTTQYTYDPNRNRLQQTMDAGGASERVVTMSYDDLNRLRFVHEDPQGFNLTTEHQYDENGNEKLLIDAKHQTVTSTYDELNRLRSKVYGLAPGDTVGVWQQIGRAEYDPDPNGNVTTMREYVASGTSPPSSTPRLVSRVYDDLDRLQSETSTLPDTGSSETVAYTYFGNGTRQTVKDPFAATTTYTYDGQNRLHSVTTADNAQTTYTYLGNGLADQVIYPNGVTATHTYDNANRLKSISNAKGATVINSYAYTYGDGRGNRTQQVETNGGVTESTSYTYDNLDRLSTITYPADATFPNGRNVTYTYDGAGNRVGEVTTDPQTHAVLDSKTGSFDAVNRLSTLIDNVDASKTSVFGYDADGNTTSKTQGGVTTTYAYDVRDKQVEVKQDGTISGQYIYDCEGRLIRSLDDQGSRQIVNDQSSRFLEIGLSGEQLAKYDYGNRLIRLTNGDGTRFFSFDGLGSATALTDPSGAQRNAFHLDAWGNYRNPAELNGTDDRVGFTGYFWSKSTNLYFARSRWYDPEIARFTSQDDFGIGKIDNPPSLHLYFYANDNPVRYIDLTGHAGVVSNVLHYAGAAAYTFLYDIVPGAEFVGGRPEELAETLFGDRAGFSGVGGGHAAAMNVGAMEVAAGLTTGAVASGGGGVAAAAALVPGGQVVTALGVPAAAVVAAGATAEAGLGGYTMWKASKGGDRLKESKARVIKEAPDGEQAKPSAPAEEPAKAQQDTTTAEPVAQQEAAAQDSSSKGKTQQIGRHTVGDYEDVGGHHPHQQAARSNNPNYKPGRAKSVKEGTFDHKATSKAQQRLNAEARRSGQTYDLPVEEQIQRESMRLGGFTEEEIDKILEVSRDRLKEQNALQPSRIPGSRVEKPQVPEAGSAQEASPKVNEEKPQ